MRVGNNQTGLRSPVKKDTNLASGVQTGLKPVGRECQLVLNKVGVIDLTPFGKFEVTGARATEFLDYMVANKLPKVELGSWQAKYLVVF